MDRILSYVVRLVVWLSGFAKTWSRWGLFDYEEWTKGHRLKVLLVGYNGARNTGADARVVALTEQLQRQLGAEEVELTVMTLDETLVEGYFSPHIRLFRFTTMFFIPLLRATSRSHVAVLCEGSTLTRTFADALCMFYCEAAGIMQRQHKPCIAYGSEVGRIDGWLARMCYDLCRDTYFIVRTRESLQNLKALGLNGHVGTDTAWTFQARGGEQWAREQLLQAGWDGRMPLMGVAVINPFCWPVRPSLWRWAKAVLTGDHTLQYDKMYFFSDSERRRSLFSHYLRSMWSDNALLAHAVGLHVVPVVGDITHDQLALTDDARRLLLADTTHVVHCAAETGVQKSKAELWQVNVEGTRHVAQLATSMPRLQRFTHVSTAYVVGTRSGRMKEEATTATHFYCLYEQSKAEAERIVRAAGLPLTVCRPGMIVGHSLTGRTRNFNTVYYVLKLMHLVARRHSKTNKTIIPIPEQ